MIDKDNSQNELESLVEMAESVSSTIESLHTKTVNLRTMGMVSFVGIYFSLIGCYYLFSNIFLNEKQGLWVYWLIFIFTVILLVGCCFFLFQCFNKIKSLRYKLATERDVLDHLLTLVFEYKDHIYSNESSYVERALIEIRLKRIGFSAKW